MSRKFRWTFEADFPVGKIPVQFVKLAARPSLTEEGEQPKHKTVMTTFYDENTEAMAGLYKVLGAYYDKVKDAPEPTFPEDLMGTATLKLLVPQRVWTPPAKPQEPTSEPPKMGIGLLGNMQYTGEWEQLEEWTLKKIWPHKICFGELDFSSSDVCSIEVTWIYAEEVYKSA